jgi:hypothetical protein
MSTVNFLGNNSFSGRCLPTNFSTVSSFSFYEESYQWFIHRFYFLNTLNTQTINLRYQLPNSSDGKMRNEFHNKSTSQFYLNTQSSNKGLQEFRSKDSIHRTIHLISTEYIILPKSILEVSKNMSSNFSVFNMLIFSGKSIKKS